MKTRQALVRWPKLLEFTLILMKTRGFPRLNSSPQHKSAPLLSKLRLKVLLCQLVALKLCATYQSIYLFYNHNSINSAAQINERKDTVLLFLTQKPFQDSRTMILIKITFKTDSTFLSGFVKKIPDSRRSNQQIWIALRIQNTRVLYKQDF